MKRIGIISDTHGYLDTIDLVLDATMDQDIDMWLHAGDYGDDARYMQTRTNVPVYAVRGNNDRVQPLEPKEQLIPLEDTYIYIPMVMRYHIVNEHKNWYILVMLWGRDSSCVDIAIFTRLNI